MTNKLAKKKTSVPQDGRKGRVGRRTIRRGGGEKKFRTSKKAEKLTEGDRGRNRKGALG